MLKNIFQLLLLSQRQRCYCFFFFFTFRVTIIDDRVFHQDYGSLRYNVEFTFLFCNTLPGGKSIHVKKLIFFFIIFQIEHLCSTDSVELPVSNVDPYISEFEMFQSILFITRSKLVLRLISNFENKKSAFLS